MSNSRANTEASSGPGRPKYSVSAPMSLTVTPLLWWISRRQVATGIAGTRQPVSVWRRSIDPPGGHTCRREREYGVARSGTCPLIRISRPRKGSFSSRSVTGFRRLHFDRLRDAKSEVPLPVRTRGGPAPVVPSGQDLGAEPAVLPCASLDAVHFVVRLLETRGRLPTLRGHPPTAGPTRRGRSLARASSPGRTPDGQAWG